MGSCGFARFCCEISDDDIWFDLFLLFLINSSFFRFRMRLLWNFDLDLHLFMMIGVR